MKKAALLTFIIVSINLKAQVAESTLDNFLFSTKNYYEIVQEFDSAIAYFNSLQGSQAIGAGGTTTIATFDPHLMKKYGRWRNYWKNRIDSEGTAKKLNEELVNFYNRAINLCISDKTDFVNWESLGPLNSDGSADSQHNQGRVECIAVNPNRANNVLIGTKNGGVYKIDFDSDTWWNTTDDEKLSIFGCRDIEFHPSIPDLVFAATGSENAFGIGVIYSEDAGDTWYESGLSYSVGNLTPIHSRKTIYDIEIDSRSTVNRTVAYAIMYNGDGLETGLYRLAGNINDSWEKIVDISPFVNSGNKTHYKNLTIDINKGNENEIWVATNAGVLRCNIDFNSDNSPNNISVSGPFTYDGLSIAPKFSEMEISSTYAGEVFHVGNFSDVIKLYKFNETSNEWNLVQTYTDDNFIRNNFIVDFDNSDIMYMDVGTHLQKSVDGGLTFQAMSTLVMHEDVRCLELYKPTNSATYIVYAGDDGGIARTSESNPDIFASLNQKGLTITQNYGIAVAEFEKDFVVTGAQDGSINMYRMEDWVEIPPGGDNFDVLIDLRNNGMVYQQSNFNFIPGTIDPLGGISTLSSTTPTSECILAGGDCGGIFDPFCFDLDQSKPDRIISGWVNVYESLDQGNTWNQITYNEQSQLVTSLQIAPSNPDIIYYTRKQKVFILTKNGSVYDLTEVTNNLNDAVSSVPYTADITDIAIDPLNENRVWVTFGGLEGFQTVRKVWFTENAGNTWQNADPNETLPNFPINTIVYQYGTNDRLYVGTDIGVFYKDNTMSCWEYYGEQVGFKVSELEISHCTQNLYATTWGSGTWKAPLLVDNNIKYYQVDQNETWTENKIMKSSILVKSGATLNLVGMNLYMPKNSKIIIERGARLNLDASLITNQCGEMWSGIEVNGNDHKEHPNIDLVTTNQYPVEHDLLLNGQGFLPNPNADQGVLVINDSHIEHARNAISLSKKDQITGNFILQGSGGIVIAENSAFINCRRSAEFIKYNFHNISSFKYCEFITDAEYRLTDIEPHHISMWDTKDVRIIGCEFRNDKDLNIDSKMSGTAIYTSDASYIARAYCSSEHLLTGDCIGVYDSPDIIPNKFVNLHRGVYSTSTTLFLPGSLQINKNDFYNVKWGIILRSAHGAIVVRNKFNSPYTTRANDGVDQPGYGIYLEGLLTMTCAENDLKNLWSGILTNSCGITNNRIYRNKIDNMFFYGSTSFGYETNYFQTGKRLQFLCNAYSNNGLIGDIAITGMIGDQGTTDKPALNTFSNTMAYNMVNNSPFNGWVSTNNTNGFVTPVFKYFRPTNTEMNPQYSFGLNKVLVPIFLNYLFNCPPEPLAGVLLKRTDNSYDYFTSNTNDKTSEYMQLSPNESEERDRLLNEIINGLLIIEDYAKIESLLQAEQSNPWRVLQLGDIQRIRKNYVGAKTTLNSLVNDQDILFEVKDVAKLVLIRVELEENNETWFDIESTDLEYISSLARKEGELPASLMSRNVLELIRGMYFEERIDDFDIYVPEPNDTITIPDPVFSLYPNPIVGVLNIDYNLSIENPFKVRIFDLLNNTEVYTNSMSIAPFSVDVSEWQSGFYSIIIENTEGKMIFQSTTKIKN